MKAIIEFRNSPILYGISIVLYGSSSPGGGFQGGVIIGAAYILLAIGYDPQESRKQTPDIMLKLMQGVGILTFVGIGLVGVFSGYAFLANRVIGFPPQGAPGSLLSGGTLLGINIGIGLHVSCTIIILFHAFLECETPQKTEITNNQTELHNTEENP